MGVACNFRFFPLPSLRRPLAAHPTDDLFPAADDGNCVRPSGGRRAGRSRTLTLLLDCAFSHGLCYTRIARKRERLIYHAHLIYSKLPATRSRSHFLRQTIPSAIHPRGRRRGGGIRRRDGRSSGPRRNTAPRFLLSVALSFSRHFWRDRFRRLLV